MPARAGNFIMNQLNELLRKQLGLQIPDTISDEELLQKLADKLASVIANSPDEFFQLMYRLDIPEVALQQALTKQNIAEELALLVYKRQMQKIQSRTKFTRDPIDDTDLQW